jgi:glucosamine 6-phosphate synthetase-like amidotransferase/phosphosugar isomerase protein
LNHLALTLAGVGVGVERQRSGRVTDRPGSLTGLSAHRVARVACGASLASASLVAHGTVASLLAVRVQAASGATEPKNSQIGENFHSKSVIILLSAGERASARLALDAPARVAVGARGAVFGNVLDAVAQPGATLPPHKSR